MAYPASFIANGFLTRAIQEGNLITQMKLQKILYFAQGLHLATYGTPLIQENFQAWKFGPVIPEIYQIYKFYGSEPITDTTLADNVNRDWGLRKTSKLNNYALSDGPKLLSR